jgi:hypothetical protein
MHYAIGCLVVVVGIILPLVILAVYAFAFIVPFVILIAAIVGLYKAIICYITALKRTLTSNALYIPGNFLKAVIIAICIPLMIALVVFVTLNIAYSYGVITMPNTEGPQFWTDTIIRWAIISP